MTRPDDERSLQKSPDGIPDVMTQSEEQRPVHPRTEADRTRHENIFRRYVMPILGDTSSPRVLSVGCRDGKEAGGLLRVFPDMHFLGIDTDLRYLDNDKKISGEINQDLIGDIEVRRQDAHDPKTAEEGPWDLIILQHPDINPVAALRLRPDRKELKTDWMHLIDRSLEVLGSSGVIYISTWFGFEMEAARKYLGSSPNMKIVLDKTNIVLTDSFGNDSYILVCKKVTTEEDRLKQLPLDD